MSLLHGWHLSYCPRGLADQIYSGTVEQNTTYVYQHLTEHDQIYPATVGHQTCPPRLPNISCTYTDTECCTNSLSSGCNFTTWPFTCLVTGSNLYETDYYDCHCFWLKTKQLEQIRELSRLLIWDSDKSVSLPVQKKAAVIQSWDSTNKYATFGFSPLKTSSRLRGIMSLMQCCLYSLHNI